MRSCSTDSNTGPSVSLAICLYYHACLVSDLPCDTRRWTHYCYSRAETAFDDAYRGVAVVLDGLFDVETAVAIVAVVEAVDADAATVAVAVAVVVVVACSGSWISVGYSNSRDSIEQIRYSPEHLDYPRIRSVSRYPSFVAAKALFLRNSAYPVSWFVGPK